MANIPTYFPPINYLSIFNVNDFNRRSNKVVLVSDIQNDLNIANADYTLYFNKYNNLGQIVSFPLNLTVNNGAKTLVLNYSTPNGIYIVSGNYCIGITGSNSLTGSSIQINGAIQLQTNSAGSGGVSVAGGQATSFCCVAEVLNGSDTYNGTIEIFLTVNGTLNSYNIGMANCVGVPNTQRDINIARLS